MKTFYKLTILFALGIIYINAYAQSITFEKTFGYNYSNEEGNCVRQTYDNGYIILNTNRGDGSVIIGSAGLIKTDSLGNNEWQKSIVGMAGICTWGKNVEITADSGYIVIGYCMYCFNASTNTHILISKTDINGNLLWFSIYDSLYTGYISSSGSDIIQTKDNGYILTGVVADSVEFDNKIITIKTDSIGNILWMTTDTGINSAGGLSIIEIENSNYLIFGYTSMSLPKESFMYLIKIDSLGNKIWGKTYNWDGGSGNTFGYSVKTNNNGEYFLFGTGMYTGYTTGEMLLIKTDTAGNVQWKKSYQKDISDGYDFDITSDDGFVLVGDAYNPSNDNSDIYLIKTDSTGTQQWYRTIGGAGWDWGNSIRQTTDNGFIIAGVTFSYGAGLADVYLVKTNDTGVVVLSIYQLPAKDISFIQIYPNPVINDGFNISFQIPETSLIQIKFYDYTGKETLFIRNENQPQGSYKKYIPTNNLPPGLYFLTVTINEKICSNKIIIF